MTQSPDNTARRARPNLERRRNPWCECLTEEMLFDEMSPAEYAKFYVDTQTVRIA